MKFLPVSLNIAGKKILIIGGGKIALQKLKTLRRFTKSITITAKKIRREIKQSGFACREKPYEAAVLRGANLVYACTDDRSLNARIKRDARKAGILVNVADDPALCDFISPALLKKGCMTIAVSSDGRNAKKSVALRNKIKDSISK